MPLLIIELRLLPQLPNTDSIYYPNDTLFEKGSSITIDLNLDTDDWNVKWSPNEIISCDTCMGVVISPKSNAQIDLIYEHSSGCTFRSSFFIEFKKVDEGIFIPNTFTPNSDDINDYWEVFTTPNLNVQSCMIYDRWGNLVYSVHNSLIIKWDGCFNGKPASSAVFVYLVEFSNQKNEKYFKVGNITLVR